MSATMANLPRFIGRTSAMIRSVDASGLPRCSYHSSTLASPFLLHAKRFSARAVALEEDNKSVDHVDLCEVSFDNGIRRIVLNNPKRRNSLSYEMMAQLQHRIKENDEELQLIILSANGPVFSSGHDLKELRADHGKSNQEKVFRMCTRLMTAVEESPVPVIAEVNGHAAAAGCQLIATCDIVVASRKSQFSTPGVNSGIFCSTPGIPLVRSVPAKVAAKMLFTGDAISAEEALRFGLITSVVDEDKLKEETMRIANRILEKSPRVITMGKRFLKAQVHMDLAQAYAEGERVMVRNLELDDCQEGLQAFLEKRKPKW